MLSLYKYANHMINRYISMEKCIIELIITPFVTFVYLHLKLRYI